jgi:hypothetical protein
MLSICHLFWLDEVTFCLELHYLWHSVLTTPILIYSVVTLNAIGSVDEMVC